MSDVRYETVEAKMPLRHRLLVRWLRFRLAARMAWAMRSWNLTRWQHDYAIGRAAERHLKKEFEREYFFGERPHA